MRHLEEREYLAELKFQIDGKEYMATQIIKFTDEGDRNEDLRKTSEKLTETIINNYLSK
jgi:hypothetical protein